MPDAEEEMIAFRIAPRDRAAIQRLVDRGAFRNRSDFLRHAVRSTLERYETAREAPNLEIEGVELPAASAHHPRARQRNHRKGVNL